MTRRQFLRPAAAPARRRWLTGTAAMASLATLGGVASPLARAADGGGSADAGRMLDVVRLTTGFAAGGTSDTICRRVARPLTGSYARSVVVENRTGAGGQIAIQSLHGQPTDGTVFLQTPSSMLTIYPHIYRKLPYDPDRDLTPVSLGCEFEFGFAVGPAVPAEVRTVPQFFEWAKKHPDKANFGSPAAGSTPHFVGALLGRQAGIKFDHAAYRGSQPALLDLIGGNLGAVSAPIGDILQQMPKVRMIGVSGSQRSRFAPDVPTFTEQGLKDMVFQEWFVFMLPAGAPAPVVDRLNQALRVALKDQEVVSGLETFGLNARSSSPDELRALLTRDREHWAPIVREIGFTAEG